MKTLAAAAAIALGFASAANAANEQLTRSVQYDLRAYGFDVDVNTLSDAQISSLFHTFHARNRSYSETRSTVRSILGGPYSVRGVLVGN